MEMVRVNREHADDVVGILVAAFAKDPLASWIFENEEKYRRLAPKFYRYMTEYTFSVGEVYLEKGRRAAQIMQPSESLAHTAAEVKQAQDRLREVGEEAAERLLAYVNTASEHHPNMGTPHIYWTWGGVLPEYQGQGIGSVMLKHTLRAHSDRPVYGEATTARSFALYQRLGFQGPFDFHVSGGGPLLRAIWREPAPVV